MEPQIQSLNNALASPKKRRKKEKVLKAFPPAAPRLTQSSHDKFGSTSSGTKKRKRSTYEDEETLTFEQNKQLFETLDKMDDGPLEKVWEIIGEVYPEIREVCTLFFASLY